MKSISLSLFWLLCTAGVLSAQSPKAGQECFPAKNELRLVYDAANVLEDAAEAALEHKLDTFALNTGNQIVVVVVPDLCGMDPNQFATELGELWGVGQAKLNNGIVLLVKPKTPESKGQYNIAIGRGLEGAIPDGETYLIAQREMLPDFKKNDYIGGIDKATNVLMALARGEYSMNQYANRPKHKPSGGPGILGFLFILAIVGIFLMIRSREVRKYASRNNLGFWAAWWLLNSAGRSHTGYYNRFRSGGGGFGGWGGGSGGGSGGGGGFGGFGGGSFGGGGSSGSW